MSRIHTNHCFCAYDLFETFNKKQLKIKRVVVQDKYGHNKKQSFCAAVFIYMMYLIICDIIENNITFVLPLFNNRTAEIYVKPITGENFKKARQNGAFGDIDILASNFTGYMITYSWTTLGGDYKTKPIYISKAFKDVFIDNINKGKIYY